MQLAVAVGLAGLAGAVVGLADAVVGLAVDSAVAVCVTVTVVDGLELEAHPAVVTAATATRSIHSPRLFRRLLSAGAATITSGNSVLLWDFVISVFGVAQAPVRVRRVTAWPKVVPMAGPAG